MASLAARIPSLGKLVPSQSCLFVCDVQEKFRPVISNMPAVIDTASRMIRGANTLGVPVLVTEQYPKALGVTVSEVKQVLHPSAPVFPKTNFSMVVPDVESWLSSHKDRKQVLLLGIEAHVCVLQTALDLLEKGYEVHVITDGVSSQRLADRAVALHRMAQAGSFMTTSEMVLFQLMKDATNKDFKAISALVREPRPQQMALGDMQPAV